MNNEEYIRAAVELADDWDIGKDGFVHTPITDMDLYHIERFPQVFKDALAAQLVRQVDTLRYDLSMSATTTDIFEDCRKVNSYTGDDRTMNTIKVIVDSKILL